MAARALATLALSLALGAALPATAAGPYARCDKAVEQRLAELGLGDDVVRSIYISPRVISGRRGDRVAGYDAWVRLAGCSGALVFTLDRHCRERQVYTRGDCRVPGVTPY